MQAVDAKRDDGTLVPGLPVNLEPVQLGEPRVGVVLQALLVRGNALAPHLHHVVEGGGEADRLYDGWRASLELVGRLAIGDAVGMHALDHLPRSEERRVGKGWSGR